MELQPMRAIYVREPGRVPYACALTCGDKLLETRTRNVFNSLFRVNGILQDSVRVAVLKTGRAKRPGYVHIVGFVTLHRGRKVEYGEFRSLYWFHLVPEGSVYDCKPGGFKWCYRVTDADLCTFDLDRKYVKPHNRSWCEVMI